MSLDEQENLTEVDLTEESVLSRKPSDQTRSGHIAGGLLAQVSTLAWNLVIPIVGGVLLGHYLDQRGENGVTWTLSLLVLGVMISFSNLYNLYIEHKYDSDEEEKIVTDKVPHAKDK